LSLDGPRDNIRRTFESLLYLLALELAVLIEYAKAEPQQSDQRRGRRHRDEGEDAH
jgi:hypothetical protein